MPNLRKAIRQAWLFIYHYKFTILCIAYFCIISVLALYIVSKPARNTALSFVLVINILAKTKYSIWLSLILSFFISFDAYFAFVYSNQVSIGTMASILETNLSEATGVLSEIILIILAIFSTTTFLILMSQRELKECNFSRKTSLILLFAYLFVGIPAISYWKIKMLKYENFLATFPVIAINSVIAANFPLVYIDISTFIAYQHEMHEMKKFLKLEKSIPEGIERAYDKESPQKIFFIVGESASRLHYSLYGYDRKTSPFLDSLAQAPTPILNYYNGYTPATITRDALRITLSFSKARDIIPFFKNYSIVEMANNAGYETIWISNQDKVGESDSYIGFIAAKATHSFYEKTIYREDFNLLNYIEQSYEPNKKQFFIIHINGSHVPYNERYDETDLNLFPGPNTKTNEYDRSIHHTDRLLRKIYEVVKREESSLLYYYSDHGEAVENGGHGVMIFDPELFNIPIVTINNSSIEVHSIVEKYIDPDTNSINSSSSVYILSELMGYEISQEKVKEAIVEGKYIYQVDKQAYPYSMVYNNQ